MTPFDKLPPIISTVSIKQNILYVNGCPLDDIHNKSTQQNGVLLASNINQPFIGMIKVLYRSLFLAFSLTSHSLGDKPSFFLNTLANAEPCS